MLKIKSLQQRLIVFLLLPVAIFLAAAGAVGYFYIRRSLFQEWQETAILQLGHAAHRMDMRLEAITNWMQLMNRAASSPQVPEICTWILQQLREQEGVSWAGLTWRGARGGSASPAPHQLAKILPPQFFYLEGQNQISLRSDFLDQSGKPLGQLEVLVKFSYLMQDVLASGWMQSNMACLVNQNGHYLAHSNPSMKNRHCLGETENALELAMLKELPQKQSGIIVGNGEVIGFHRLHTAPWAIMLHARSSQILAPILRFQLFYSVGGILCLGIILVLIRLGMAPLISAIRLISRRSTEVAEGDYGEPLPVKSRDEMGQLTESFNAMVMGLKERDFISNTFGRYVDQEIARELLSRPEASRMGGEKREVVILFSDVRGFTPLAETLSPEAVIHLLNRHFARMIEVIQAHRGIIVDFLGDAILAFFDPLDGPMEPVVRRAIRCALKLQAAVEAENLAAPGLPALHVGIGLHAGEVVVGNIGSESRAKYGIIGAAVNLTHRIQGQAKGGEVVVSETVFHHCQETLSVTRTLETRLKGIAAPVKLYVVESMKVAP